MIKIIVDRLAKCDVPDSGNHNHVYNQIADVNNWSGPPCSEIQILFHKHQYIEYIEW